MTTIPQHEPVHISPGQLAVVAAPCTVTTVVGSSVAVSLYDPVGRLGGLSHYTLPCAPVHDRSLQFGDVAVTRLLAAVVQAGAEQRRLVARVVGGACALGLPQGDAAPLGLRNVRAAMKFLFETGIPVVTMDIEGDRGRRVVFHADTGDLIVRSL
jgi:chemotaxis protein CheD